jgi:hypothetical protein
MIYIDKMLLPSRHFSQQAASSKQQAASSKQFYRRSFLCQDKRGIAALSKQVLCKPQSYFFTSTVFSFSFLISGSILF